MGIENIKRKADGKAKGLKSTAKAHGTAKAESSKEFWELRLYVAGQTPKFLTAFANLKKICEEHLEGKYRIEVIDLLKNRNSPAVTNSCNSDTGENLPEPIKR
jgi:circadian clock protein KaiB